ncbi:MAG TPA: adenine deaminase, partial [Deltaproteobacteria bacterium]|nr:adenine deaminase [Deltaproteobacteria bacterium]
MDRHVIRNLLAVAKGNMPPDLVILNGKLINVFTNSIEEDCIILIKDGFIVSVEAYKGMKYDNIETVDAQGLYLCPGFIDAHTHLDSMFLFSELVPYALRGGTTTVVTECAMVAGTCGMDGVYSFIESTRGYPLRCYFLAPPLTPPFPEMEGCKGITFKDFSQILKRGDFVGIGEAYWTRVVDADDRVLKQATLALTLRKRLDGHSAGARGRKLIEYLLTGITSCHESINTEEALEKLRHGLYVMIRQGFVRKELAELSKLKDMNLDTRRLILVSDSFDSIMLSEVGYMDSIVRDAIGYGFSPIEAIKMVTINPADYYGLRYLGAIAPMRYADILFLKSIETVAIEKVMAHGKIVYSEGH